MATSRSSRARLFIALDLPDGAREALVEWRAELFAGRDDVRLVADEALHVTLAFLGYKPEAEIERIAELTHRTVTNRLAPLLRASGGGGVVGVPRRRPRLFALGLEDEDGPAGALQAALARALAEAGLYEPEERPFWPHLTLARVRKGGRAALPVGPEPPAEPWHATAVTLYRSHLSPKGARYEAVTSCATG